MSDIQNMREIVEKFDELQSDLEVVAEKLDKNFAQYDSVSNASSDIIERYQAILKSVNTLQINSENITKEALQKTQNLIDKMSKYYSEEYTQTKKDFNDLLGGINSSIRSLKSEIENTIINSAKHIDIRHITDQLEGLVNETAKQIAQVQEIGKGIEATYANHATNIEDRLNKLEKFAKQKTNDIAKEIKAIEEAKNALAETRQAMIDEAKKQKKQIKNAIALPRLIVGTVIVALMIGLIVGSIAVAKLTDKPIVQTVRIYDLPELRKKMTNDGWVHYRDVEAVAQKYEPKPVLAIAKIPWWAWLVMAIGLLFLLPIGCNCEKDENRGY